MYKNEQVKTHIKSTVVDKIHCGTLSTQHAVIVVFKCVLLEIEIVLCFSDDLHSYTQQGHTVCKNTLGIMGNHQL